MKNRKQILKAREREALYALNLTRAEGACTLSATVSPCSWMYRNYGLQIKVEMDGGHGGEVYLKDRNTKFEVATVADVKRLFDQVKVIGCSRCGKPAFDRSSVQTNRDDLCEVCFMKDLNEEFDKEQAKELRRDALKEKKQKACGYTHRVAAWIHPEDGSDFQVDFWIRHEPNNAEIADLLKQKGSQILDDYVVKAL